MSCLLWGGFALVAGWGIEEMRIQCWNNLKKYEFNAETIRGNIERGEKTFWRRCGTIDTSANKIPPLSLAQTCNTQTYAIPPPTRQHCRLSICRYFGIWQNQKQIKKQSDDEASWLVYLLLLVTEKDTGYSHYPQAYALSNNFWCVWVKLWSLSRRECQTHF